MNAALEIRLSVPVAAPGPEPPEICCRGHVVRTVAESNPDGYAPGYAVAIDDYDILPPSVDFLSVSSR
jgi:hypothetical protein